MPGEQGAHVLNGQVALLAVAKAPEDVQAPGVPVERVEAPTAALEFARRLAQHGIPVNALVRAYRLGQRRMNELVFGEVRAIDVAASVRLQVLEAITATLFEYIDWISGQVVAVYEEERERWLENQNSLRGLRVRELLTSTEAIDIDGATASIQYPLRWHHLAVLIQGLRAHRDPAAVRT